MGRALSLILLCVAAFAVANARAEAPTGGKNTQEDIDKCDREQAACKSSCDRTIIDVDDNVARCKKGCDTDRGLCLQYRVGGPAAGNRADGATTRSPGDTATAQPALVCCYFRRGQKYEWRKGSCTVWGDRWGEGRRVHPARCSDGSARSSEPASPVEGTKVCCRYATSVITQPTYKWETRETCQLNKGRSITRDKCFAVTR